MTSFWVPTQCTYLSSCLVIVQIHHIQHVIPIVFLVEHRRVYQAQIALRLNIALIFENIREGPRKLRAPSDIITTASPLKGVLNGFGCGFFRWSCAGAVKYGAVCAASR